LVALALAGGPIASAQLLEPRIVGGSPTTIAQYPWQAAVVFDPAKVTGNPFQRQFCGGSLITPSIVLTAAHCIQGTDPQNNSDLDPDDVDVVLGQTTLSSAPPASQFNIQGVSYQSTYDPSYGPGQGVPSNDVGYLVLQSAYNGATPIDIADPDEGALWDPGSLEQITGWGATATSGPGSGGSDTLRHATVPIVTDSSCASSYGVYFNGSTMVCAGYSEGGIDTCFGDSGGPMQAAIGGGAYRLVGITSWGSGCAEPDAPGVYTRVAGDSLRSAIAAKVSELETAFGLPHETIIGVPPPPSSSTMTSTCKGQPATIIGTVDSDVRSGTAGSDVIVGLGGNDRLSGLAGNDLICGGPGKDTLKGGKGNDKLYGESGKDTLKGGPGTDKLKGGAGKDKQVQ
jgi:trypsin